MHTAKMRTCYFLCFASRGLLIPLPVEFNGEDVVDRMSLFHTLQNLLSTFVCPLGA